MKPRPGKPLLFGIDEKPHVVLKAKPLFDGLLKGKRRMFIELRPETIEEALLEGAAPRGGNDAKWAYQLLTCWAARKGVKVLPLRTDRKVEGQLTRMVPPLKASQFRGLASGTLTGPALDFLVVNHHEAEKGWARKLRRTGSRTLVVMHPVHAAGVATKLRLPKANVHIHDYKFSKGDLAILQIASHGHTYSRKSRKPA